MSEIRMTISGRDYSLSGDNVHCATCATLQRELADARAESGRWRTFVSGKILAQIPEREHPTYMDMEDLSLCLDQFKLDPWMVKVINAMRHTLNDLAYARERAAASAPGVAREEE